VITTITKRRKTIVNSGSPRRFSRPGNEARTGPRGSLVARKYLSASRRRDDGRAEREKGRKRDGGSGDKGGEGSVSSADAWFAVERRVTKPTREQQVFAAPWLPPPPSRAHTACPAISFASTPENDWSHLASAMQFLPRLARALLPELPHARTRAEANNFGDPR